MFKHLHALGTRKMGNERKRGMKEGGSVQFVKEETSWVQLKKSGRVKKTNESVYGRDYEDSGTRKGEGRDQEEDQKKK